MSSSLLLLKHLEALFPIQIKKEDQNQPILLYTFPRILDQTLPNVPFEFDRQRIGRSIITSNRRRDETQAEGSGNRFSKGSDN